MSNAAQAKIFSKKKAKKGDWISDLDEKGYAVVPGVLTDAECDSVLEKMKSFIAGLGRNIEERNDLSNIHGIYQHYGVGQSAAVWEVRTNPAVARPFEEIYGTNDLLVSFDGFCLMLPTRRFQKGKYWLHMDQSAKATGRQCIQGYVNLFDSSTDRTGSLLVLPGSHLKFADFFRNSQKCAKRPKLIGASWRPTSSASSSESNQLVFTDRAAPWFCGTRALSTRTLARLSVPARLSHDVLFTHAFSLAPGALRKIFPRKKMHSQSFV